MFQIVPHISAKASANPYTFTFALKVANFAKKVDKALQERVLLGIGIEE